MSGAALGDVLPAIVALGAEDAQRVLGHEPPERPIEELPAEVLLDEWIAGGRLAPPIAARLSPVILDHESLRETSFVVLLPDLIRSNRPVPPALAAAARFPNAQRWESIEG